MRFLDCEPIPKLFSVLTLGGLALSGCESQLVVATPSASRSSTPLAASVQGVTSSPAGAAQILSGQEAWSVTGTKITGVMPNFANWNMNSSAWPGAGYFSGLTSTVAPSNVCTGTQIFGSAGAAICQSGSTTTPAGAGNTLVGLEAWSATGSKFTGTMPNQGGLDAHATFPGAGFYNGTVTNLPLASQVVTGNTLLGVAGTAGASFGAFTSSTISRDVGTSQITLLAEVTTYAGQGASPALPAGGGYAYRSVPKILLDDEGLNNSDMGCASNCTPIVSITVAQHAAFVDCGTAQSSFAARIADCSTKNGAPATWNGQTSGTHGESTWKLVTRMGASSEVWQDTQTGLVWSSSLVPRPIGGNWNVGDNWCRASGDAEASDPANFCNSATYQPQYPIAESECAEEPGLVAVPGWCSDGVAYSSSAGCTGAGGTWAANPENYSSGIYSPAKGGMGRNSAALKVRWRLPTRWDFQQADNDGIRFVMPDMGASSIGVDWTSTLMSQNHSGAWAMWEYHGAMTGGLRSGTSVVRCVGR